MSTSLCGSYMNSELAASHWRLANSNYICLDSKKPFRLGRPPLELNRDIPEPVV